MIPDFLNTFFFEIGKNFSTETYMLVTKTQGILWSLADIVIIYIVLRIASLVRERNRKKKILFRYVFLWLSALLVPFLVLTETPGHFFFLESVIFGLQFAVLVYTLFADAKDAMVFLRRVIVDNYQQ